MTAPLLLTVKDVMQLCRVHRDAAFELMHAAGAVKIGRSLRVRPDDLDEHLRRLRDREAEE